jgi:carbon-monoxide dehydrogenase medium subunit
MIPAAFEYAAPESLDEAIALLEKNSDAKILAGGHSLLPLMKLRLASPELLVDLRRVPGLDAITENGGIIRIGGMVTHATIESSDLLAQKIPLLPTVASEIGDPQVRNRGTIGGSLAHADPAADLPAAALALDVQLVAQGPGGERVVEASAFFVDLLETALEPHEVLTEVRVPIPGAGSGSAYAKFPNPASHYAVVGVAARIDIEGGAVREARIAVTGAADVAYRSTAAEERLQGSNGDATAIAEAAGLAVDGQEMLDDLSASAVYRAHLVSVHAQRAMERAMERAVAATG